VAEVVVIIARRVSAIAVVASVNSWIDTRSYVVHNAVVCANGCTERIKMPKRGGELGFSKN
jgi:hypothetical protein